MGKAADVGSEVTEERKKTVLKKWTSRYFSCGLFYKVLPKGTLFFLKYDKSIEGKKSRGTVVHGSNMNRSVIS